MMYKMAHDINHVGSTRVQNFKQFHQQTSELPFLECSSQKFLRANQLFKCGKHDRDLLYSLLRAHVPNFKSIHALCGELAVRHFYSLKSLAYLQMQYA